MLGQVLGTTGRANQTRQCPEGDGHGSSQQTPVRLGGVADVKEQPAVPKSTDGCLA